MHKGNNTTELKIIECSALLLSGNAKEKFYKVKLTSVALWDSHSLAVLKKLWYAIRMLWQLSPLADLYEIWEENNTRIRILLE